MTQDTKRSRNSDRPKSAPVVAAVLPRAGDRCQILTKKGFLTARNLSSDLAILLYSKEFQLGVLLQLPAGGFVGKVETEADAFAKPALALILSEFETLGVKKTELVSYAIGGCAAAGNPESTITAVRRALWSHGLVLSASDLGGQQVRSVWMDVENGRTIIRSQPILKESLRESAPLSVAS